MGFVDDLSTWYLRRSRDRFKSDDMSDKNAALATTRYIFSEFAKISAPFIPFYAEYLYGKVKSPTGPESVHLTSWPLAIKVDEKLITDMAETRKLVTTALQERSKANIKVRQPLAQLSIKTALTAEFMDLIRDEVNVKMVVIQPDLATDTLLDTVVNESLRKEGVARDLIRAIQELRKTENLTVGDKVALLLDSDEKGKELVAAFLHDIKKVTLVTGVEYTNLSQVQEMKVEEYLFKIGLKR
jgi:isoleucyl-tRNA synthetase